MALRWIASVVSVALMATVVGFSAGGPAFLYVSCGAMAIHVRWPLKRYLFCPRFDYDFYAEIK